MDKQIAFSFASQSHAHHNTMSAYGALQVSCLEGLGNGQLAMSLYKLIASVSCTLIQLST